jgi:hypothetical protein
MSSLGRLRRSWIALVLATMCVGCNRVLTFEHEDTMAMVEGEAPGAVAESMRFEDAAVGVFVTNLRDGYLISMPNFGADLHDRIEVSDVLVIGPITGDAVLITPPEWEAFSEVEGRSAVGALRIATIGAELSRAITDADGDLAIEIRMEFDGVPRVVALDLARVVRYWPPTG